MWIDSRRLGRYVSVSSRAFRLRFVSDVSSRTLRIGRFVSVSSRQTCRPSITMRSRSRRPPSALMLMGCNEAKAAPPPSQQPSRARHSAQHHQGLSGALRDTQRRAHRSALRSLRKRDGAAANAQLTKLHKRPTWPSQRSLRKKDGAAVNARCRWTRLSPSRRRGPQSVQGGPKSPSLAIALTTALTTIMAGLGT